MADRREQLLDAAIGLLGESGMHGLTHRRVEAAAGAPAGSASNHFRTREALLDAVVVRFAELDRQHWEAIAGRLRPRTPAALAAALAEFAYAAVGEYRALAVARYAILVEAGVRPALRAQLLATGAGVDAWMTAWLERAGSADPGRDAPIVMNHWTGMVLHAIAVPGPEFDPRPQITTLVTSLMGAEVSA